MRRSECIAGILGAPDSGSTRTRGRSALSAALVAGLLLTTLLTAAPALADPTGSIAGTVTGPTGAPLPGIRVVAEGSGGGMNFATTATDGTYAVKNLFPDDYWVQFICPPGLPSGSWSSSGFVAGRDQSTNVTVPEGAAVTGINVQVPPGVLLSGKVTNQAGKPLPNIRVTAGATGGDARSSGVTGSDGKYVVAVLPGTYDLYFQDPIDAYRDGNWSSAGYSARHPTDIAVVNDPVPNLDVSLPVNLFRQYTVSRFGSADQYATAAALSRAMFDPGMNVAYIASGADVFGALSGVAAAGVAQAYAMRGPLLYVTKTAIPPATAAELARVKPLQIIVVGPPSEVSNAVLAALKHFTKGTVTREGGADAASTAAAVSKANYPFGSVSLVVVASADLAGAFSGAAGVAATLQMGGGPVLFVTKTAIPTATAKELARLKPGRIVVVGPTSAIGARVVSALARYTSGSVTRDGGADVYATAATVSRVTNGQVVNEPAAFVASGADLAGVLAGIAGAAAGGGYRLVGPVLYVTKTSIPLATATELGRMKPEQIVILGSTSAISTTVGANLRRYLASPPHLPPMP